MSYAVFNTPDGLGHAKACLQRMAPMALAAAHTEPIRQLAVDIVHQVPGKDVRGELQALYVWVRDNIRYRFDPVGLELLQTPAATLRERAGDCAAMTTLLAALAQSLGHKVKYRTVGPRPNRQAHVQLCAWDGKGWVHIDPVTEPVQPTAAARPNDLGTFGRFARGADHYYEPVGGKMLGFIPTAQERDLWRCPVGGGDSLGFIASQQDQELWVFTPFERNNLSAMGQPNNPAYRGRPTFGAGVNNMGVTVLAVPRGAVDMSRANELGRIPIVHRGVRGYLSRPGNNLGAGWTVKDTNGKPFRTTTDDTSALQKYVRDGHTYLITNASPKQPDVQAYLVANKARILSDAKFAAETWPRIAKQTRAWIHNNLGPKHSLLENIVGAGKKLTSSTAGKVATAGAALVLAPVLPALSSAVPGIVTSAVKPLRAVRDTVLKAVPIPGVASAVHMEDRLVDAAKKAAKDKLPVVPSSVLKAASAAGKAVKTVPALTRALDTRTGRLVMYTTALSGLGLRPTFSMSLGDIAATKALAIAAVNAVTRFIKSNGQPPQMKLPDVLRFQQADGALKADSLWGNNTRAAAAWYMGVAASSLPAVAKPWAGNAVTWKAPTSSAAPAPKPVVKKITAAPKPAPKPVQPVTSTPWFRSAQLVSLANAAVAAINKFRAANGGKSPAIKLSQVTAYQSARITAGRAAWDSDAAKHVADGLYGATAQADMAQTLDKATSAMPPYNVALMKKAAPKPTPIVKTTATPAPKPVDTVTLVDAPKPVVKKASAAKPVKKTSTTVVAKKTATPIVVKKADGSTAVVVAKPDAGGGDLIDPWAGDAQQSTDIVDPWAQQEASDAASERKKWLILLGAYWWSRRHRRAA